MRVGRRPGMPAPEPPSLELCPSAGVDSWPGLTVSAGVSPRRGHHLSLAPSPPNGKHKPPRRLRGKPLCQQARSKARFPAASTRHRRGRSWCNVRRSWFNFL